MWAYLNPFNRNYVRFLTAESKYGGLDGLRALAILMVIFMHTTVLTLDDWASNFYHMGWLGVDLFFVLSGFLIADILLRKPNLSVPDWLVFLRSRVFRLWPVYLFTCVLFVFNFWYFPADLHAGFDVSVKKFLLGAIFVPSQLYVPGSWSLAVEVAFYIVFSLSCLLFRRHIFKMCLVWVVIAPLVRYWLVKGVWDGTDTQIFFPILTHPIARMDELLYGVLARYLIAYAPQYRRFAWPVAVVLLSTIIVFLLMNKTEMLHKIANLGKWWVIQPTISGIAFAGLLLVCFDWKSNILARILARISYSVYLIHFPIHIYIIAFLPMAFEHPWAVRSLMILLPIIVNRYIEWPGIVWGKSFLNKKQDAA